jgi:hypothetical protein
MFHLGDILQNNFSRSLYKTGQGIGPVFARGLPRDEDLQKLNIFKALSTVLNTVVKANEVSEEVRNDLTFCVHQGWLHNDDIGDREEIIFFFPTSLHRWYLEWKLFGYKEPETPLVVNITKFVVDVIRLFNPCILSAERRIGTSIQRISEAQYQNEFYHCSHVYPNGSLLSFPEFRTATGRIDFHVQSKNWGVELLCDGNQLEEHSGRFAQSGAYGGTLVIDDYVILDCCVKTPVKPHIRKYLCFSHIMSFSYLNEDFDKLYHVVFENNFTEVYILNDMLDQIDEFKLLSK